MNAESLGHQTTPHATGSMAASSLPHASSSRSWFGSRNEIEIEFINTNEASGTAATMAPSGLACRNFYSDRRTLRSGSARWLVEPARVEPAGEAELRSRLILSDATPAGAVMAARSGATGRRDVHLILWGRAARSARESHKLKVASSNLAPATKPQRSYYGYSN